MSMNRPPPIMIAIGVPHAGEPEDEDHLQREDGEHEREMTEEDGFGTEDKIEAECREYSAAMEAVRAAISAGRATIDDVVRRAEPFLGDEPDWSSALFPNPPSHDFITWLLIAELLRREHGSPGPLKVTFLLERGQLGVRDYGTQGIRSGGGSGPEVSREHCNEMLATSCVLQSIWSAPSMSRTCMSQSRVSG